MPTPPSPTITHFSFFSPLSTSGSLSSKSIIFLTKLASANRQFSTRFQLDYSYLSLRDCEWVQVLTEVTSSISSMWLVTLLEVLSHVHKLQLSKQVESRFIHVWLNWVISSTELHVFKIYFRCPLRLTSTNNNN